MTPEPGSLSNSLYNNGRFYYCMLKEQVDVYGDFKRAQFFLHTIRKEFPTPEARIRLRALLTVGQWEDLRRLVAIVKSGKVEQDYVWIKKAGTEQTAKQKLQVKESKMVRWLLQNRQVLTQVLPITSASTLKAEEEFEEFGRSDLMLIADRVGYPIEVKDETGTDRLSGQIFKYVKGAIRLLKLGWYDEVCGVVIAPSFTQEALMQLKQGKIVVIQMNHVGDSFELRKVD